MTTQSALPNLTLLNGRRFFLSTDGETVIGSSGCAVLLAKPSVLPRHARIIVLQSQYWIEDLGGGVFVNGQRISARTNLHDGDTLSIAGEQLTFHPGTVPPQNAPKPALPAPISPSPAQATHPVQPASPPIPLPTQTSPPIFGQPRATPAQAIQTPVLPLQPPRVVAPLPPIAPAQQQMVQRALPPQQAITNLPQHLRGLGQPQLEGQVIMVDGPHMEEPDPNIAIMLAKVVMWIFLFPILLWRPGLTSLLLFGRKDNKIPTRYLRVSDQGGQNFMVRMKGEPARGAISQGDQVSFWGHWDGGTLQMSRAFNHQINADVLFR